MDRNITIFRRHNNLATDRIGESDGDGFVTGKGDVERYCRHVGNEGQHAITRGLHTRANFTASNSSFTNTLSSAIVLCSCL